jgi:molecular chaperone GrpE (heat shock protein)
MGQLSATNKTLKRLAAAGKVDGREALAELARALSRRLDDDDPDATLAGIAAVSKELRAVLAELELAPDDGDDDFDDELRRLMRSPLGDAEGS